MTSGPTSEAEAAENVRPQDGQSAPGAEAPVEMPPGPRTKAIGKLIKAASKRHEGLKELLRESAEKVKDSEFVHDVRVAARRLGEVARLLASGRFMDKPSARAVDASLKQLRQSVGELRDADVTREHLLKWRMPGPVKKVAREVADDLADKREKLEGAAREQLGAASISGTMVVLARVLEQRAAGSQAEATERLLASAVTGMLKKREKQMRKSFGKAARKQTAESLHEARITVKKLRYVMELAEDAGTEKGAKKKVKFLKGLQELLGDHHDVHVILEQVQGRLSARREKPIKGLSAGWRSWHRLMERGQAERAAEFFAKSYAWVNEKS